MEKSIKTDIAIVGGGVAGLWLLNRLRQLGLSVVLLESRALGDGQTRKAQGIIHGGTKYTLQGNITPAALAIAEMPALWQACLEGRGEIDLSAVSILSSHQYLFSSNKIAGRLAGFFAKMALKGKVVPLDKSDFPSVFQHPAFKGMVYSLDEMAIDVMSLVRQLAKPYLDIIFSVKPLQAENFHFTDKQFLQSITIHNAKGHAFRLEAQRFIFTAGIGNELWKDVKLPFPVTTQRRPLHMVLVKTPFSHNVFAHCLSPVATTPRMTITTHLAADGSYVWYLGGEIAEEGVKRDQAAQIHFAKKELAELFPWLDFSKAQFATFFVDRAEPLQAEGRRPDHAYFQQVENSYIAWPTKLALAPKLADDIVHSLVRGELQPGYIEFKSLAEFSAPPFAIPIWDELL